MVGHPALLRLLFARHTAWYKYYHNVLRGPPTPMTRCAKEPRDVLIVVRRNRVEIVPMPALKAAVQLHGCPRTRNEGLQSAQQGMSGRPEEREQSGRASANTLQLLQFSILAACARFVRGVAWRVVHPTPEQSMAQGRTH